MAYNNFYPNYFYPNYPQYQPPQTPPQSAQQSQPQMQNGGFISVRSEVEARNYPIAPGNSITFIDENAPYCYTKTMGFSQLDRPRFEKYRLVKEEEPLNATVSVETATAKDVAYVTKTDIEGIEGEISGITDDITAIRKEIEELKAQKRPTRPKKEGDE